MGRTVIRLAKVAPAPNATKNAGNAQQRIVAEEAKRAIELIKILFKLFNLKNLDVSHVLTVLKNPITNVAEIYFFGIAICN